MDKPVPGPSGQVAFENDLENPVDLADLFELGALLVKIYTTNGQTLSISRSADQSPASSDAFVVVYADVVGIKIFGSNRCENFEPIAPADFEISRMIAKGDQIIGTDQAVKIQWFLMDDPAD